MMMASAFAQHGSVNRQHLGKGSAAVAARGRCHARVGFGETHHAANGVARGLGPGRGVLRPGDREFHGLGQPVVDRGDRENVDGQVHFEVQQGLTHIRLRMQDPIEYVELSGAEVVQ